MKKIFLINTIICFCSVILFAQHNLTIKITSLHSNKGQIYLYVFDKDQNKVAEKLGKIENNDCQIKIDSMISGQYAFKYFHDENNNGKLDCNWMGIPKEAYGFSNNARGSFGPPPFEKWVFEINDHKKMVCIPTF